IGSGMIRVFDEKLDAPTFMYSGGDERNKVPGKPPVLPGVPRFLGGNRFKIEPVKLPAAAWYPGLKPFVQREEIAKREATISAAEIQLAAARAKSTTLSPRSGWYQIIIQEFTEPTHLAVIVAGAELARAQSDLASINARIAADRVVCLGEAGN